MKRLAWGLLFFIPGMALAVVPTQTKYSPFTGTLDFITTIDTHSIQAGTGISIASNSTGVAISATGSAASSLEVFSNYKGGSSSPTASIGVGNGLNFSISGSTANFSIDYSSVPSRSDAILNQSTLQTGTYYVSSGTVQNNFNFTDSDSQQRLIFSQSDLPAGGGFGPQTVDTRLFAHTFMNSGFSGSFALEASTQSSWVAIGPGRAAMLLTPPGTSSDARVEFDVVNEGGNSFTDGTNGSFILHPSTLQFNVNGNIRADWIDNSGGEMRLYDSDGSNYVGLRSSATVGSNLAFTLPSADGSNGQVMKTDGSGNLSFGDASGMSAGATYYVQVRDTLQSGATFYVSSGTVSGTFSAGSIGVATTTPNVAFEVIGNSSFGGASTLNDKLEVTSGNVRFNSASTGNVWANGESIKDNGSGSLTINGGGSSDLITQTSSSKNILLKPNAVLAVAVGASSVTVNVPMNIINSSVTAGAFIGSGSVFGSTFPINIAINGNGSAIVAGSTVVVTVPFAFTISTWTAIDPIEAGSISVHISSASYSDFPTLRNISGAGNSPFLSSAQKNTAAISGWSQTVFPANTILAAVIDSATTATQVDITIGGYR